MGSMDERLKKHPNLKKRFETILDIAENAHGDCIKANDAGEQVIEEVRKLGQEILQDWANNQNSQQMQRTLEEVGHARPYKKNSTSIQLMGE